MPRVPGGAGRLWLWLRILSVDVVLGGLAGGGLAVCVTGVAVPHAWWFVLGGAIWVVYSADHIFDARRIGRARCRARYRLHACCSRWIVPTVLAVGVLCGWVALRFLPRPVFIAGVALGAVGALHLVVAQASVRRWIPKELSVAAIYTAGIWLLPVLLAPARNAWLWLAVGLHALAVLLNMAAYAVFEAPLDEADDSASVSRLVNRGALVGGTVFLTALGTAGAGLGLLEGPAALQGAWWALLLVIVAPLVFLAFPSYFHPRQRYRVYGELSFLILALPYLARIRS